MLHFIIYIFLVENLLIYGNSFKVDLDVTKFVNVLNEYVEHSLKAEKIQKYLSDSKVFKPKHVDQSKMLNQMVTKYTELIKIWQGFVEKLRDAVDIRHTSKTPIVKQCCEETVSEIDPLFSRAADQQRFCEIISPIAKKGLTYFTKKFGEAAKANLKTKSVVKFQYYATVEGLTARYPAAPDQSCDSYDARARPWYIDAVIRTHKQVVFVLDASGSMALNYHGHQLIEMVKEAVEILVGSLSINDRYAVIAAADNFTTPSNSTGATDCFNKVFSIRSDKNYQSVVDFLKNVEARGGTYYIRAMNEAFKYFEHASTSSNSSSGGQNKENILIFFTDGSPNEDQHAIVNKLRKKIKKHPVELVIFNVGKKEDTRLLNEMVKSAPKGRLEHLNDFNKIKKQLIFFFKPNQKQYDKDFFSTIQYTHPYIDAFGLGQVFSIVAPVKDSKGKLAGVISMDISFFDVITHLGFSSIDEYSYYIIADTAGLAFYHSLFPVNDEYFEGPNLVKLFESSKKFTDSFTSSLNSNKEGETQDKLSPHPNVFGGTEFYGSKIDYLKKTYIWKLIPNSPFILILVLHSTSTLISTPQASPRGSLLYHRIDLLPPKKPCQHYNLYATVDHATFVIPVRGFEEGDSFETKIVNEEDVKQITSYLEGSTKNVQKVKSSYKAEVFITNYAEDLWINHDKDNDHLRKDVLFRYMVTPHGVLRCYPGIQLPTVYDPFERKCYNDQLLLTVECFIKWFRYKQIKAFPQTKHVISSPYILSGFGTLVISIGRALHIESGKEERLSGAVCMDLILSHFNELFKELFPLCSVINRYKCYLLDLAGFLIVVSSWRRTEWYEDFGGGRKNWELHITEIEPEVSVDMIQNKIMTESKCTNVERKLELKTFRINLGDREYFDGAIQRSFFHSFSYRLYNVSETNVVLLIRTLPVTFCHASGFECPCNNEQCFAYEEVENGCQCPCYDAIKSYNPCNNEFENTQMSSFPCVPVEVGGDTPAIAESEDIFPIGYPLCNHLIIEKEKQVQDDSLKVILFMSVISIMVISLLLVHFYLQRNKVLSVGISDVKAGLWHRESDTKLRKASLTSLDETIRRQMQNNFAVVRSADEEDKRISGEKEGAFTRIKSFFGLKEDDGDENEKKDDYAKEKDLEGQRRSSSLDLNSLKGGKVLIRRIKRNIRQFHGVHDTPETSSSLQRSGQSLTDRTLDPGDASTPSYEYFDTYYNLPPTIK